MGLLDVFRPRWKHSDPAVRLEALKNLDDDEALSQAACRDEDERVRRVAIRQMIDPWRLKNVAHVQSDEKLRALASARARELFVEIALSNREAERTALSAVRDLDSQEHLAEIAVKAPRPAVRTQALDLVVNKGALMSVIKRSSDSDLRKAALLRLSDGPALKQLAIAESDVQFAALILDRIKDQQTLLDVAQKARHKPVAKLARQRCQQPAETTKATKISAPQADAAENVREDDLESRRRHARQYQLAREAEGLAERATRGALEDEVQAQQMETEWSRINKDAELDVRIRFERALQRFAKLHGAATEARRTAEQKEAAARTSAKVRELAQRMASPEEERVGPAAEASTTQDRSGETKPGDTMAESQPQPDQNRTGFSAEALEAELHALRTLQSQLETALRSESLRTLDGAVKQSRGAEKRLDRLPQTEREALSGVFGKLRSDLTKKLSEAEQREAWKRWANVKQLEALCQQAEVLRDVLIDFPDKEQGPKELANLRAAWRKVGPVPASKRNELWIRFRAACDSVMEIVQAHRTADAKPEDALNEDALNNEETLVDRTLVVVTTEDVTPSAVEPGIKLSMTAEADDDSDVATVVSHQPIPAAVADGLGAPSDDDVTDEDEVTLIKSRRPQTTAEPAPTTEAASNVDDTDPKPSS